MIIISSEKQSNRTFILSFITSSILLIFGLILFLFFQQSASLILLGLLAILIGGIQILADFGWMFILKANRAETIHTWTDALNEVAKVKGQRIFALPIIMDLVFILISISLFNYFSV